MRNTFLPRYGLSCLPLLGPKCSRIRDLEIFSCENLFPLLLKNPHFYFPSSLINLKNSCSLFFAVGFVRFTRWCWRERDRDERFFFLQKNDFWLFYLLPLVSSIRSSFCMDTVAGQEIVSEGERGKMKWREREANVGRDERNQWSC